ncbi:hypothetical protein HDU87_007493 [Geranomyces variabilis]|uniref:Uncharacterized protein n=1 Tax=Geranomyces variabilis TaxID=109894 RepID=A0AAD5TPJ9_9FUNG|nr:hypothetical protein HDU87_007493 [Geranomyces variabilis]
MEALKERNTLLEQENTALRKEIDAAKDLAKQQQARIAALEAELAAVRSFAEQSAAGLDSGSGNVKRAAVGPTRRTAAAKSLVNPRERMRKAREIQADGNFSDSNARFGRVGTQYASDSEPEDEGSQQ